MRYMPASSRQTNKKPLFKGIATGFYDPGLYDEKYLVLLKTEKLLLIFDNKQNLAAQRNIEHFRRNSADVEFQE